MDNHNGIDELLREWVANQEESPQSLSEMEQNIREWLNRVGKLLLTLWLQYLTPRYDEVSVNCPHCSGKSRYQRWQSPDYTEISVFFVACFEEMGRLLSILLTFNLHTSGMMPCFYLFKLRINTSTIFCSNRATWEKAAIRW